MAGLIAGITAAKRKGSKYHIINNLTTGKNVLLKSSLFLKFMNVSLTTEEEHH